MSRWSEGWRKRRRGYADPAFASAGTTLSPVHVDIDECGHFVSVVFSPGVRHYMFEGTANRDRFVNRYRPHGAKPCKDPSP